MSTIAITAAPIFARPVCDTRPRRGKHKDRTPLLERAGAMLAGWKWIRAEAAVGAAAVGAVIAPLLIG